MSMDDVDEMLNKRSGLKGLAGHQDMREVRRMADAGDERARLALAVYAYRVRAYIGAYRAILPGLKALVFTAGIGENSAPLRTALCGKLAWLGVKLDEVANNAGGPRMSTADSLVSVWVIPTDEEWVIAQHTLKLIGLGALQSKGAG